jgi:TolB-like protein
MSRVVVFMVALVVAAVATAQQDAAPADPAQPAGAYRVVLAEFEAIPPQAEQEWIGRSIERNLVAELARRGLTPLVLDQPREAAPDLLETARQRNADFLVSGEYHVIEPNLRITGRVVEVRSGRIIAGLSASGTVRDLFGLQDRLVEQVRAALPDLPAVAERDQVYLRHPPRIEPSGPLQLRREPGYYDGSDLQRAVHRSSIDRYYYQPPAYYHPPFYGFVPYHPHWWHGHSVRIIVGRPIRVEPPVRFDPTRGHGHVAGFMPMTVQQPLRLTPSPME